MWKDIVTHWKQIAVQSKIKHGEIVITHTIIYIYSIITHKAVK